MGYCSDVSLVMTRKLFGRMLQELPEASREMINLADRFEASGDAILLFWEGVKWETRFSNQINHFLEMTDESEKDENGWESFRYHYVRIGESTQDIGELGGYWDNPWETGPIRYINLTGEGEALNLEAFL